jgi:3-phosphoshikimate 1-carboxyvinyltransferase
LTGAARIIAQPGRELFGRICVPGDKSISHRALMLGALANGITSIRGFLAGEDCLATLAALRQLGVFIDDSDPACIRVRGVGLNGLETPAAPLDMGNSGTGLRLLAGVLAGQSFESILTGDKSLQTRPMERVAVPLRRMGAGITTRDGCPPVTISGGDLQAIYYDSPVASAQVKSAILLAALYADGSTSVSEPGVTRDHTERMFESFGVPIEYGNCSATVVGPAELSACDIDVPGDLSSAAFPLAAGCLSSGGRVEISGVGVNPTRTGILEILRHMGADIDISNVSSLGAEPVATLTVKGSSLRGARIPEELVPLAIDELPLVFALAACADGETVVTGAAELRHKESDRISIMAKGLQSLGARVEELEDGVRIQGGGMNGGLQGGTVDSAGDHRIAMAFSVAAMCAAGPVEILDTANVATSFPGYVPLMQSLGMRVSDG